MLNVRRPVAHAQRHDHLMVAVDGQLAVVALDVVAVGLHQVAVGVGEIPHRVNLTAEMCRSIRGHCPANGQGFSESA